MHYYSDEPVFRELRVRELRTVIRGLNLTLLVAPGVFSKDHVDPGTRLLAENMVIMRDWRVLDLGCGYGVLGIVAAKLATEGFVIMTDVNTLAVKLASINIRLNKVPNAEVRRGNLYEPVKNEVFNTVVTNPPISAGLEVNRELIEKSKEHLAPGGSLQIVFPRKVHERFEEILRANFDLVLKIGKSGTHVAYMARDLK
ncbi:class I SAM-dependent methyltransferase [Vulcanisaeta thermophila]|uniref:class I SAM-dependent methyltransferase n=1 Tax=Vulcanisaeta thermophila TaxID=867917 RepID=UPI00085344F7|nr:methyltransferase [Vulcanisaeta thermophila]